MPVSIIANSAALTAQRAISQRNESLTAGANRLSSGLRVTSAGEDAAALAVGTSLKIINSGLNTAALNASAAVSTLQIADGAMGEVGNLLIRMQALATQASSGQLDDNTRSLVNTEFQTLKTEVDRIARSTEFNGVKLLAGARAFTTTNASSLAAQGIAAIRPDPGLVTTDRSFRLAYTPSTEVLTLTRIDGGAASVQSIDLTGLLDAVAGVGQNLSAGTALDVGFASLGVTLTLDNLFNRGGTIAPAATTTPGASITVASPAYSNATTLVPQDTVAALLALSSGYSTATGALTVPLDSDGTNVTLGALPGISYRVNGGAQGASNTASAALQGAGPNTIEIFADRVAPATGTTLIGSYTTGAVATTGAGSGTLTLGVGTGLIGTDYTGDDAAALLTYKVGIGVTAGQDLLNVSIPALTTTALGINTLDVTTAVSADNAIVTLGNALTTLNQGRATVGAQQLRLEQIGSNLGVVTLNNEAARSALLDADISKEISTYTADQALLEAGVAMLARANQLPNVLLQLLRNG